MIANRELRFCLLTALVTLPCCSRCDSDPSAPPAPGETLVVTDRCDLPRMPGPSEVAVTTGLMYVARGTRRLELDIARPTRDGPHPLVVVIHGGGWRGGNRGQMDHEIRMLAAEGYAAATIDYRLVGRNPGPNSFPAAVQDVRCAIRFLRASAEAHAIDTRRVVLLGLSAGGHLAALTAAVGDDPRLDGDCPMRSRPVGVSGVVALFAPLDLRPAAQARFTPMVQQIVTVFLGVEPSSMPALAALASPVTHVKAGAPPFLLIHGAADRMVPIRQSRDFKAALDRAGVPALLVEVPRMGHGFPPLTGTPALRRATCTTLAFLKAVLRDIPKQP